MTAKGRTLWIGALVGAIVSVVAAGPNFSIAFLAIVVAAIAVGAVVAGFIFEYLFAALIAPPDLGSKTGGGHTGPIAGGSIDSGFGGDGGGDG